jgi:hypothetical protein
MELMVGLRIGWHNPQIVDMYSTFETLVKKFRKTSRSQIVGT